MNCGFKGLKWIATSNYNFKFCVWLQWSTFLAGNPVQDCFERKYQVVHNEKITQYVFYIYID
jgi:hypothetical protein